MQRITYFLTNIETYGDKIPSYDKFAPDSLTEPTGLQNEKTTNDKAFSKTVLIVDDDFDMTSIFSLGLQDEGLEVYSYNDPLDALSQFRPNFYDLLLIDINMPKMDGRTVLKELKQDPDFRMIPVVVLTTSKDDEDVYKSYDLGVNSYIVKPVTFEALVDILQTLEKYWFEIVELPQPRES